MKSKEILFSPVEKVRTDELLPGFATNTDNEYAVVIEVGGQKKIVNFCSKQYELMTNEFVLASFENALRETGLSFKRRYYQRDWSRFYIDYLIDKEVLKMKNIDDLLPKIQIVNSYDGKVRLTTRFGLYRLVCKNGMTVAVKGTNVNKKLTHTPSIYSDEGFQKVVNEFQFFVEKSQELIEPFKILQKNTYSYDRLAEKIQEVIEETSFPKRQAEEVQNRVYEEVKLLNAKAPNDWLLYNGFNYLLNHNHSTMKMDQEKRYDLDQQILTHLLA
jgi:hypothetical protein